MKGPLITMLIFTWLTPMAQVAIGVNTGLMTKTTNSPMLTTQTQDIIIWSDIRSGPRFFFGINVTSYLFHKFRVKQEVSIYQSSHSYKMLVPDNDPNSYFLYFKPVTWISFITLNYRGLIRVLHLKLLNIQVGPSLDFDLVNRPYDEPPYYAPNYPAAIALEKSLAQSYNPVTFYADIELSFELGRFSLGINYKHSLTSQTGKFVYEDNPYKLRSTSKQFFLRLGFMVINDIRK